MQRSAFVVVAAVLATGCATGSRAYMDSAVSNRAEPATVWNRPQEVGFEWAADLQGEATQQCVFFAICWGADDGGGLLDGVGTLVGSVLGHSAAQVTDPLVRAAAATAVKNAGQGKADGIYVVAHDTDSFNIGIYKRRTAWVRGKGITIKTIGEVSQDRADKNRNLHAIGGGALLQLPEAFTK